ncbi:MAG: hypothetical protein CVT98_04140 [Bacteroidetes bacterium HGW-Bacteroidetes-15]|nr:MAG: hypothetical protein CVT98_04140 [Bacteroidetes bacterium HGW-Bacteroidetes-15]
MVKFAVTFISISLLLGLVPFSFFEVQAQQRRQINIEGADQMRNLKRNGQDIRRLIGNVRIRHEDVTVTCDSLYDYSGTNRFDAFGNVVVIQKSSTLYGDTLLFDGNSKNGRVRGDIVRLVDEEATLVTKFLDFNTQNNTVYFFNGGIINTNDSRFSSQRGTYHSNQKYFVFAGDVSYLSPDLLLNTDSLNYNSNTEIISFFGPTRIYNEENYLYCESGWHNRVEEKSEFRVNAYLNNGEQRIFGDKIYYDRILGYSEIIGNGCIIDSAQNMILYGNEIEYYQETEYAEVRKNPLAISISEEGDSLFLRADVFIGMAVKDSVVSDSTLYNLVKGIGDVRFYRSDFQGICDSMVFHSTDSILYMYNDPILWNEDNQLSANNIDIVFKDDNIHKMLFKGSAFVVSQEDTIRFNQIRGREMVGFFKNGALTRLDVNGNGETVYFARDKGVISAVNKAEGSRLTITLRDNAVVSIMFREKPIATLFPIDKAELQDVMLKGFSWQIEKRPTSNESIIPEGLNPNFYIQIENKAKLYRAKKQNPAESVDSSGLNYKLLKVIEENKVILN